MRYKNLKDAPLDQSLHTPEMGIAHTATKMYKSKRLKMNKSLISRSTIFMSAFFLSSCSLVVDYLNADIRDRLYNTHNAYIDMYHITSKDKISNDLDDKFSWSNKKITSYLQRQDNIEQYLRNVGALCPESHNLCFFFFVKEDENECLISSVNKENNYKYLPVFFEEKSNKGILLFSCENIEKNKTVQQYNKIVFHYNFWDGSESLSDTKLDWFKKVIEERVNYGK